MFCTPSVTQKLLEKDLKEAWGRLKIARSARDDKECRVIEKRLDWLLDRLGMLLAEEKPKGGDS